MDWPLIVMRNGLLDGAYGLVGEGLVLEHYTSGSKMVSTGYKGHGGRNHDR